MKTVDFFERIAAYDMKDGTSSQQIELIKVSEYLRFMTLIQGHLHMKI